MNSKETQCNLFLIDNLQNKNDNEKKKDGEETTNFNLLKKLKETVTNKGPENKNSRKDNKKM